ncbi:MAG: metallopeptidase family protein [Phycisphaerae bacterium]|nr:metallopeptidase family protein [Phycisphaerae bacterium]
MADRSRLSDAERARFDALLEEAIEELPEALRSLMEHVPVIAIDAPTPALLAEMGVPPERFEEEATALCGLHSGRSNLERSVEHSGEAPPNIHLFRVGIINEAFQGGRWWGRPDADDLVFEQIWVTLLHEIGHQFGLDEDDLERLGYA